MVTLISSIWSTFFSWMPISLQIAFGVIVAIAIVCMLLRVLALLWDSIPFC